MSFLFFIVVLLILNLWMVVRIWRDSALMGILCLLVPGVILFALIRNWGDPESDIKIPFLLSIVVSVMFYFSLMNLAEREFGVNPDGSIAYEEAGFGADDFDNAYLADQYTDEEREQLRQDDPELAALLDDAEQSRSGGNQTSERWESATPVTATEADEDAVDPKVQRRQDQRAARRVLRQSGPIEIGPAYARLQTPSHFSFVAAPRLNGAARLHRRALDKEVIGWVVHERVSLADDLAWFAEIRFEPVGHLQANGVGNSAGLQQAVSALGGRVSSEGMFAPQWSTSRAIMTWIRSVAGSSAVEAVAALPLRHGVLSYVVRVDSAKERELALRTARLMASKTTVGEGWRFADAPEDSPAKGPSLAQWIAGAAVEAPEESG